MGFKDPTNILGLTLPQVHRAKHLRKKRDVCDWGKGRRDSLQLYVRKMFSTIYDRHGDYVNHKERPH